jgi:hypothetical protein
MWWVKSPQNVCTVVEEGEHYGGGGETSQLTWSWQVPQNIKIPTFKWPNESSLSSFHTLLSQIHFTDHLHAAYYLSSIRTFLQHNKWLQQNNNKLLGCIMWYSFEKQWKCQHFNLGLAAQHDDETRWYELGKESHIICTYNMDTLKTIMICIMEKIIARKNREFHAHTAQRIWIKKHVGHPKEVVAFSCWHGFANGPWFLARTIQQAFHELTVMTNVCLVKSWLIAQRQ